MGPATAWAMVDLLLTIDRVIAAALGIMLETELAEGGKIRHWEVLSAR